MTQSDFSKKKGNENVKKAHPPHKKKSQAFFL